MLFGSTSSEVMEWKVERKGKLNFPEEDSIIIEEESEVSLDLKIAPKTNQPQLEKKRKMIVVVS
jgi:hypothetical protein